MFKFLYNKILNHGTTLIVIKYYSFLSILHNAKAGIEIKLELVDGEGAVLTARF